jgi:hypothetical protein
LVDAEDGIASMVMSPDGAEVECSINPASISLRILLFRAMTAHAQHRVTRLFAFIASQKIKG